MLASQAFQPGSRLLRLSLAVGAIAAGYLVSRHDLRLLAAAPSAANSSFANPLRFTNSVAERVAELAAGTAYDIRNLVGPVLPDWYSNYATVLLCFLPFAGLVAAWYQFVRLRGQKDRDFVALAAQVVVALGLTALCISLVFGPDEIWPTLSAGERGGQWINVFPLRMFAGIVPMLAAALALVVLSSLRPGLSRLGVIVIAALSFTILRPLYEGIQDIFPFAEASGAEVVATMASQRSSPTETILIRSCCTRANFHTEHPLVSAGTRSWYHYRMVQFLLPVAPAMLGSNIAIINDWNDTQLPAHIPHDKFNAGRGIDRQISWEVDRNRLRLSD